MIGHFAVGQSALKMAHYLCSYRVLLGVLSQVAVALWTARLRAISYTCYRITELKISKGHGD